ncbi:YuiA family protein [Mangrovibacillus cuniculi]|uniref:YuiA family protein n=1 Tax=Mangrovibacillus cuniculi TaxID=2593652 RepID=A0A7S8CCB0_9BACI|nr:YuiA family protein [Mangrovibacillus cuniculi]QPC47357.1 hypothetical protein G8O30_10555 [Mangrovibacillus cuniculi]
MQRKTSVSTPSCPYCGGKGYFQLVLGGTETCPECHGSGNGESYSRKKFLVKTTKK